MSTNQESQIKLLEILQSKLGDQVVHSEVSLGDAVIFVSKEALLDCCKILQLDADLHFNMLVNVTAVDYMDSEFMPRVGEGRFEVVYHLLSIEKNYRLRIRVSVSEKEASIPSVTSIWAGADFMESEVWDMYGINFENHPDLRRILMYEEFKGFPLRKDYPVQGKQPRIPLRHPEVQNTARRMQRPELVQINKKSQEVNSGQ